MNIYKGLELYEIRAILDRLLPYGIDKTMTMVILHALNYDLSLLGIDFTEEGIFETGYYSILDRLPFNIYDLSDREKEVLGDYCMTLLQ